MTADAYTKQDQSTGIGEFNITAFLVQQMLNKVNIATVVKVVKVTNSGGVSPVGYVDVLPLVNQLTGQNKSVPHTTVYNIPYFRLQGGTDAIILDPKVGDLGICIFADRDISAVKVAKGQANPGSFRRNSFSDGMYLGGILNGTPEQYIQFSTDGIKAFSPTKIRLESPLIEIVGTTSVSTTSPLVTTTSDDIEDVGPVHCTETIMADGEITAVTTPLHTHVHGEVSTGSDDTGPPIP